MEISPGQTRASASPIPSPPFQKVRRLPELVINQIAAGEVVERPASVVKELVENSLDAQSTRIDIQLVDGGMTEIRIVDDGWGMDVADLILCVERHTTSKLTAESDLERIGTFGFRGEALASIASVAEVEIKSRTRAMPSAHLLRVEYGASSGEPRPVGAPAGTAIVVRKLFERLPGRLKFLRSAGTEFSHCARMVRELALGNPEVSFHLQHQGKAVARFVARQRRARFIECLRADWEPMAIREESTEARLEAYLSPPDLPQSRGELFWFINGRGVRHRTLAAAVRNAYLDFQKNARLAPQEPSGVIYIDLRPDWVDVNVHPQKLEVRLLRQEMLYSWVSASVRKALATRVPPAQPHHPGGYSPMESPIFSHSPAPQSELPRIAPALSERGSLPIGQLTSHFTFLGRTSTGYVLMEDEGGLLVVDERRLAEGIELAALERSLDHGSLTASSLLVPRVIRVDPSMIDVVCTQGGVAAGMIQELGLELECFGDGDVALKSRPERLPEPETESFVRTLLAHLANDKGMDRATLRRSCLGLLARQLVESREEHRASVEKLILELGSRRLDELPCVDNRPLAYRLGKETLHEYFGRK